MASNENSFRHSAKLVGLVLVAVVLIVGVAAALVRASDIFLILFLGVLFGVFMTRLSGAVSERTPLSYAWSLGTTSLILASLAVGGIAMFGVKIEGEIAKARDRVDEAVEQLRGWADEYPIVDTLLESTPFVRRLTEGDQPSSESASKAGDDNGASAATAAEQSAARQGAAAIVGVFATTFGLVVNTLLILFVGLFLAAAPAEYREGVVTLFPPERRDRTREILDLIGDTLWRWLIGRFATMLITGSGAALLLLALGVPMAISLGVVTALLTFIPNIGAVVALVLATLLALPKGGTTLLLVVVGYVALQLIESYIITPMIQQKQSSLPPALLLAVQAVMGVLFGILGAAVASPALAAAKVAVEEIYIKDVLESSAN